MLARGLRGGRGTAATGSGDGGQTAVAGVLAATTKGPRRGATTTAVKQRLRSSTARAAASYVAQPPVAAATPLGAPPGAMPSAVVLAALPFDQATCFVSDLLGRTGGKERNSTKGWVSGVPAAAGQAYTVTYVAGGTVTKTPAELDAWLPKKLVGASFHIHKDKWVSQIKRLGTLGNFDTEVEAARKRDEKATTEALNWHRE